MYGLLETEGLLRTKTEIKIRVPPNTSLIAMTCVNVKRKLQFNDFGLNIFRLTFISVLHKHGSQRTSRYNNSNESDSYHIFAG